jgi:hypothetical protein
MFNNFLHPTQIFSTQLNFFQLNSKTNFFFFKKKKEKKFILRDGGRTTPETNGCRQATPNHFLGWLDHPQHFLTVA